MNSVLERDLSLQNGVKDDSYLITSQMNFACLAQGSLRPLHVCDGLRCYGLHAHYTDAFNEFRTLPEKNWSAAKCIVMRIDYCT